MKSAKDIEQLTIQELETISFDEKITVPDDLEYRIQSRILSRKKKTYSMISAAAAVAVIVTGLGISFLNNEPKDTFDNPYLAYAELEKAFARMSGEIQKGLAMAEKSEAALDKVTSIFE